MRDTDAQPVIRTTDDLAINRPKHTKGWVAFWLAAFGTLALLLFICNVVLPWWQGIQDHWQYGSARITQFDANVGHGGTSHFVAEYYHQQVLVIEMPQADLHNYHVYVLTGISTDTDTLVVQLATERNADGRLDLIVTVQGMSLGWRLHNTGSAFTT